MGERRIVADEFLGVHIGWIRAQFVACGYASHAENIELSIEELELRADKNMYQQKAEHYKNNKINRRNE